VKFRPMSGSGKVPALTRLSFTSPFPSPQNTHLVSRSETC
jgi:hypothetical protein